VTLVKPTLHLLKVSGLTPEEEARALADFLERITGWEPPPEELEEEELQAAKATEPDE